MGERVGTKTVFFKQVIPHIDNIVHSLSEHELRKNVSGYPLVSLTRFHTTASQPIGRLRARC